MKVALLFFRRAGVDILARAATLVLLGVLARCWDVIHFGRFVLALTIGTVILLVMDGGIHLLFLREIGKACSEEKYHRTEAFGQVWENFLTVKLIVVPLGFFLGLVGIRFLWPWGGYALPIALLLWAVGQSWIEFLNVVCNATGEIRWSAFIMGFHRALTIIPALGVAFFKSAQPMEVGIWMGAGSLVAAGAAHFFTYRRFWGARPPCLNWGQAVALLRRSSLVGGALVVYTVGFRMGIFLLPRLSSPVQVGYYGAVHKLIEAALMAPAALMLVATRSIVSSTRPEDRQHQILKTGMFIAGVALLWFLSGQWGAPLGVLGAFGDAWMPAVPVFRVLLVASGLGFANCFLYHVMVIRDKLSPFFWIEVTALLVSFFSTYLLAGKFGALGAAIALIIFESVRFILSGLTVWRAA